MSILSTGNPLQDQNIKPLSHFEAVITEIKHVYRSAYLEQTLSSGRSLTSIRQDLTEDVDYDPVEDKLYLWYEDPTILTPEGRSYNGACLTSYPDVLHDVTRSNSRTVIEWVKMRAYAHSVYDAAILQCNSSVQLKSKLMRGVIYFIPDSIDSD
jgi:hypothetical protein